MSVDLWNFFFNMPAVGCTVESSYCVNNECNFYEGVIDFNNIWAFPLTSNDGKTIQVDTSILDFHEPKIGFNIDDHSSKISIEVTPEDCEITQEGFFRIKNNNQGHEFTILIKNPVLTEKA